MRHAVKNYLNNRTRLESVTEKLVITDGPKSKYCILITAHTNLNELQLNANCFNRSKYLTDNFDIIITTNGSEKNGSSLRKNFIEIAKSFNASHVELCFDSVNSGGHWMGAPEQISNCFDCLLDYNLAIHIHPDVYIISDHGIKNFVKDFEDPSMPKCDFYVFELTLGGREGTYAFDSWIMVPSKENNIFFDWDWVLTEPPYRNSKCETGFCPWAECWFYDALHLRHNKVVGLWDRSPNAGMKQEYEKNSGLINTGNMNRAVSIFNQVQPGEYNDKKS